MTSPVPSPAHPSEKPETHPPAPPLDPDRMVEADLGDEADIVSGSAETPPELLPPHQNP